MATVFINYRRDQTAGEARALYNDLVERLGEGRVFMDVDDIGLGRDFREVLRERLADAQVMLSLIGRDWADARDAAGQRRLDQPEDFVRLEIATALERKLPVIPVLLQGAAFPAVDKLPPDLRELGYRNGFAISHATWESNVNDLVRRLGLPAAAGQPAAAPASRRRLWMVIAIAALVLVLVIGVAVGTHDLWGGGAPDEVASAPGVLSHDDLEHVFDALGGPEGQEQEAAARRLMGELAGSPQAVSHAARQLNPDRWFPMRTFKGRSEVVGFLIAARDEAYTPEVRAQVEQAIARIRRAEGANKARITPQMSTLLQKLEERLAAEPARTGS